MWDFLDEPDVGQKPECQVSRPDVEVTAEEDRRVAGPLDQVIAGPTNLDIDDPGICRAVGTRDQNVLSARPDDRRRDEATRFGCPVHDLGGPKVCPSGRPRDHDRGIETNRANTSRENAPVTGDQKDVRVAFVCLPEVGVAGTKPGAKPHGANEWSRANDDRPHVGGVGEAPHRARGYFLEHCDGRRRASNQAAHLIDQLAIDVNVLPVLASSRPPEDGRLPRGPKARESIAPVEEVPCQRAKVGHRGILPAVATLDKVRAFFPRPSERRTVGLWAIAMLIYIALGIWQPPVFLLGFQESLIFVFVATVLIGRIAKRRK